LLIHKFVYSPSFFFLRSMRLHLPTQSCSYSMHCYPSRDGGHLFNVFWKEELGRQTTAYSVKTCTYSLLSEVFYRCWNLHFTDGLHWQWEFFFCGNARFSAFFHRSIAFIGWNLACVVWFIFFNLNRWQRCFTYICAKLRASISCFWWRVFCYFVGTQFFTGCGVKNKYIKIFISENCRIKSAASKAKGIDQ